MTSKADEIRAGWGPEKWWSFWFLHSWPARYTVDAGI
jgi:hypothetical protein